MTRLVMGIHRFLLSHRVLAIAVLVLLVAGAVALALRVDYEEDIAKFLPVSAEQQAYRVQRQQRFRQAGYGQLRESFYRERYSIDCNRLAGHGRRDTDA